MSNALSIPRAGHSTHSDNSWSNAVAALDAFAEIKQVATVESIGAAHSLRPVGPALGGREVDDVLQMHVALLKLRSPKSRYFVLDLTQVRSMTACGLGLCSDLAKRAREAGLEPILFGASREFLDALRMFKTDRLYHVIRTRNDLVVYTQA